MNPNVMIFRNPRKKQRIYISGGYIIKLDIEFTGLGKTRTTSFKKYNMK